MGVLRWGWAPLLVTCCACSRGAPSQAQARARPERIVPTSATAVDVVATLVDPARIAAIPDQALEYSLLHDLDPRFASTARFQAYLAEPLLALRPDLVVIDPWQAPETTQRLGGIGVEVWALPEVRDWPDARRALILAADVLDARERCAQVLAELDGRVEALRTSAATRPHWRALAYSNFGGSGSTAGEGTTLHAVFELVGLRNAAAEGGRRGHVGLTFEELLTLDPDLIVVSLPLKMPEGPAGDRGGAAEKVLCGEPSLAGLRAIREHRILRLPAWLFATGSHELVRAAETLASELDALASVPSDGVDRSR